MVAGWHHLPTKHPPPLPTPLPTSRWHLQRYDQLVNSNIHIPHQQAATNNAAPQDPPNKDAPKPSGFAALASSGTNAGGFASFSGGGFAAAAASSSGFGAVAASSAAAAGFSFAGATKPNDKHNNNNFSFVTPVMVQEPTDDHPEPVIKNVFGAPDGTQSAGAAAAAVPEASLLPLQDAKTGEEDEQAVFTAQGTLFEFDAGKTWRERGRGELRVNVPKQGGGAARLVMRSKGNLRLLMNASLWPDMVVTKMDDGKVCCVTQCCCVWLHSMRH